MAFLAPFIPTIVGAGSALAGSLKQNSKEGRTATSEQQSHRTSTTEGVLGGRQHKLNKNALNALIDLIQQGPQVLQADKNLAFTDINKTYNSIIPRLQSNFTSRGMGQSGALNQAMQTNEYQRANARGTALAGLQSQAMNRYLQTIGLAPAFLTPRTINTTEDFTGTGTNTGPNQLGNITGATGFALAQFLKQLLGGGGGPFNAAGTGGVGGSFPDYNVPGDILSGLQGGG